MKDKNCKAVFRVIYGDEDFNDEWREMQCNND